MLYTWWCSNTSRTFIYIIFLIGISFRDLLDKPPETKDVFALVRDISALWNELGREFDVPENDCVSLSRNTGLSDENRLESVLSMWITNETKDVKWRVVIEALKALRRKDVARKVIMYLQKPKTYSKYISKDNFFSFHI